MEIKVGDKVRVSKVIPNMYLVGFGYAVIGDECKVREIDEGNTLIKWKNKYIVIPTKYLTKVNAEAKEAKFKKGDKVRFKKIYTVVSVDDGQVFIDRAGNHFDEDCLELYTEPTEQTEAEKKPNVGSIKIPVEVDLTDSYWDAYTADLAKEIAVKLSKPNENKPGYVADYAVSVAKAVVENLKKK